MPASHARWALRERRWHRLRDCASWLLAGLSLVASLPAHAQELVSRGNLVFAAERMFGLYLDKRTVETPAIDIDLDASVIGLGWSLGPGDAMLTLPRLGVDYFFLDDHLTLGGSLGVASVSGDAPVPDEVGILLSVLACSDARAPGWTTRKKRGTRILRGQLQKHHPRSGRRNASRSASARR